MAYQFFKPTLKEAFSLKLLLAQYGNVNHKYIRLNFPEGDKSFIVKPSEDVIRVHVDGSVNLKGIVEKSNFWVKPPSIKWDTNQYPLCIFSGETLNDWAPNGWCLSLDVVFRFPYPKVWYNNYLQSVQWIEKRNEALKLSKYSCSKCGKTENLQVHHLNYNTIGNESQSDLFVCCKSCHKSFHK